MTKVFAPNEWTRRSFSKNDYVMSPPSLMKLQTFYVAFLKSDSPLPINVSKKDAAPIVNWSTVQQPTLKRAARLTISSSTRLMETGCCRVPRQNRTASTTRR